MPPCRTVAHVRILNKRLPDLNERLVQLPIAANRRQPVSRRKPPQAMPLDRMVSHVRVLNKRLPDLDENLVQLPIAANRRQPVGRRKPQG